ncbi:hypothetical protein CN277_26600 [Bacillus cereus]|nr:hypothetical protein COM76_28390 [Bacillus cereus]PGA51601.1 hypothetical protein COL88_14035 [Bacillus thuringiensis]PEC78088.1 hypothetical protein CON08_19565 [Bacillus cereus]PEE57762.1 hypothetical protein COM68_16855 [Bacillus cereus]PEU55581.1 hypothetical protein CN414_14475 [Bacillus cereus]
MKLLFRNNTPNTVNIVLACPDKTCDWGVGIKVLGWYVITPGDTQWVYEATSFFPEIKTVYWYATDFLGHEWTGPELSTHIYPRVFDYCYGTQDCADCRHIGMRVINLVSGMFAPDWIIPLILKNPNLL